MSAYGTVAGHCWFQRLLDNQYRTIGVAESAFRDAAEEESPQSRPTMAAHDDHRGANFFRVARDDCRQIRAMRKH